MTTLTRRAAVWKSRGRWISEKGHTYHTFKAFAVVHSPIDPDKDSEHPTWAKAMENALAYVAKGEL